MRLFVQIREIRGLESFLTLPLVDVNPFFWSTRMVDLVFPEESYAIMGACFDVYNQMGPGFTEPIYQECLELELTMRGIPFVPQRQLKLSYKGKELKQVFIPDFFCFEKIILEIKAAAALCGDNRAQVHNYLKATGQKLGILVNFGNYASLEYERIVR